MSEKPVELDMRRSEGYSLSCARGSTMGIEGVIGDHYIEVMMPMNWFLTTLDLKGMDFPFQLRQIATFPTLCAMYSILSAPRDLHAVNIPFSSTSHVPTH
jgi:hypothetical protein